MSAAPLFLLERLEDDTPPARAEDAAWIGKRWQILICGVVSPPAGPSDRT